jgi:xylan 1,4-beta-xylosidase
MNNQTPGRYENPVIRGVNPDPSACRVGEDFYLVTSSMHFYPGVPVYHSRDLVNWRLIGHALTRRSHFCLDRNKGRPMIFAATLRHHEGIFYVITTDVNGGGNFYVTASDPAGPWSDPVFVDRPMFDPSFLFDDDGKVYYTRRGDFKDKDIVQAEIDIRTGRLLTSLRSISKGLVSDDTEGPHLYKVDGWYYLSMGEGGSRFLHMQTVGRSRSPWGPFEACPHNPFIAQHNAWWHSVKCLGHADFVESQDGRWWVVFLGTRHAHYNHFSVIGRETFLAPVEWVDGWPVVRPEHQRQLNVEVRTLPLHPWPISPERDEFQVKSPALEWTVLAYPERELSSLSERPGYLRLRGQSDSPAESKQAAFIGRRQEEMNCSASAALDFEPLGENEEAGLTVFQTRSHHYDIFKTLRGGSPAVVLRKTVGDMTVEAAMLRVERGPLDLKIESDPDTYRFYCADRGSEWRLLGSGQSKLIATEVASVWSGVLLGMYSTGNGAPCGRPADFDWFEYRNLRVPEIV